MSFTERHDTSSPDVFFHFSLVQEITVALESTHCVLSQYFTSQFVDDRATAPPSMLGNILLINVNQNQNFCLSFRSFPLYFLGSMINMSNLKGPFLFTIKTFQYFKR